MLNRDGKPLKQFAEGEREICNFTAAFVRSSYKAGWAYCGVEDLVDGRKLSVAAEGRPSYKILRKTVFSWLRDNVSLEVAEQALAHVIPTSGKDYAHDERQAYAKMNAGLAKFRTALKASGVI